jgi:tRNA modification GTPase
LLRDGITLALVGAPNVGKSSLLNRLAGESRAIVTPVPGTTRDLVRVELSLDGLPVEVVDTAGLRDTAEPVEIEGVRLAREQAETADVVLWITDATSKVQPECLPPADPGTRRLGVINKIDLTDLPPGRDVDGPIAIVRISALTGAGIDDLRLAIREAVGYQAHEGNFTARKRHLLGLDEAVAALDRAAQLRSAEIELLAEELRLAHAALGGIVGQMTPDELLGEIFASFCIGK